MTKYYDASKIISKKNLKNKELFTSAVKGLAPFHVLKYLFLPVILPLKIVLKSFNPDT